jgi:hypothetical protein
MQLGFGSGMLWGVRTDGPLATPYRFGALQDVNIEFKGDIKELFAQFQFPVDAARGKTKITGKAKLAEITATAYNNLFFGQTVTAGQTLATYNVTGTVPAMSTYTVTPTVPSSGTFLADLGVHYATGSGAPLQNVGSGGSLTAAGQYKQTAGVYTFDMSDASAALYFDFAYTTTGGFQIAGVNTIMGTTPKFTAYFNEVYEGNSIGLILYACQSASIGLPTKVDDYMMTDFDFSAYANAAGQVFNFSTTLGTLD